jgi:hypothetical protein
MQTRRFHGKAGRGQVVNLQKVNKKIKRSELHRDSKRANGAESRPAADQFFRGHNYLSGSSL